MNFLVHRNFKRKWTHMDAYKQGQGYYLIEVGSWTLEVETTKEASRSSCNGGKWYLPNKPTFWVLFLATSAARATGVVGSPEESLAVSAFWASYFLYIVFNHCKE